MCATDLDGGVLDGHDTRHDVDDPLRVDDDATPQELVVEVLQHTELVQELHRLRDLQRTSTGTA